MYVYQNIRTGHYYLTFITHELDHYWVPITDDLVSDEAKYSKYYSTLLWNGDWSNRLVLH